jgi:hypothetical protein
MTVCALELTNDEEKKQNISDTRVERNKWYFSRKKHIQHI